MAGLVCSDKLALASRNFLGSRVAFQSAQRQVCSRGALQVVAANPFRRSKKWVSIPVNKNGKAIMVDMHVQKGDTVQVIAGNDKGTIGEITDILRKSGMVVVKGVNIKTKHVKPRQEGEVGSVTQTERPVHHSNVMLYSTEQQVRSRVGHKVTEDGKKVRYLLKTGEVLD